LTRSVTIFEVFLAGTLAAVLGVGLLLLWRSRDRSMEGLAQSLQAVGGLRTQLQELEGAQERLAQTMVGMQGAVQGVATKVVESTAGVREALGRDVQDTRVLLERLKAEGEARRRLEEEVQASARRIETVLVGARTRGLAGEHILDDAFRLFPPDMIDAHFRVNGKAVEYALVLANHKRLPIDSKWAAADLVERLADPGLDPGAREALAGEVERVLRAKVREVRQYIDPAQTLPWAVAAIPDAVFALCRQAHLDAYREGVVLMPYSMTIPYLLALYRLHLQYARSIDAEHLEAYLQQVERGLDDLDRILENQVTRGATMVAYTQARTTVGQMRNAALALRPPLEGVCDQAQVLPDEHRGRLVALE
jgi:hypothetical protein